MWSSKVSHSKAILLWYISFLCIFDNSDKLFLYFPDNKTCAVVFQMTLLSSHYILAIRSVLNTQFKFACILFLLSYEYVP